MAEEQKETRQMLAQGSILSVGILLAIILFTMFNYLSLRHYKRFDWTSSQLYSLSEKSLNVARNVDQDIDLIIFMNPASELYGAASELLDRYAAANPKYIKKREIDLDKNLLQARQLLERYAIERENVLVVSTAGDRRVIDEFDLAEFDYSGAQYGQGPTMQEFKGEQLITSAILALAQAKKPKVLFTQGHGESPLEAGSTRSLSQARDLLGKDNFAIEEWSSLGRPSVPEGTDLLVIAGPTTNFLPPELKIIGDYLHQGGRLLLLLDPVLNQNADGLIDLGFRDWLTDFGIEIRQDVVIDPSSELPFFGPETIFTDSYGDHPIVEALSQTRTRVLFPLARSVSQAADAPGEMRIVELVKTSTAGWGETDLNSTDPMAKDATDLEGPVNLGVALAFDAAMPAQTQQLLAETDQASQGDVPGDNAPNNDTPNETLPSSPAPEVQTSTNEARMVVFGDLDFATDAQITNSANSLLLLNTLNWLVKREQLIDIEGKQPEQTKFSLSQAELSNIYLLVLVFQPALAIVLGIFVFRARRR